MLMGDVEADALGRFLTSENSGLEIIAAPTREQLDTACANPESGTRLIALCSSVIVPGTHLEAIDCGIYNFHPGPPSYPGRYPSVFALYEGAKNFGVTVHHMVARVEEGPIVAAEWFPVPEYCDLETLDTLSFKALVSLFGRLAKPLATDPSPLRTKGIGWSGTKCSKTDCDVLCTVDASTSPAESEKRIRACGPHLNWITQPLGAGTRPTTKASTRAAPARVRELAQSSSASGGAGAV
ncbi:MAG: formyltransferase family protein [Rhodospirillaceae bacterium]